MKLTRYEPTTDFDDDASQRYATMRADKDGEYVRLEDVEKLVKRLKVQTKDARRQLRLVMLNPRGK